MVKLGSTYFVEYKMTKDRRGGCVHVIFVKICFGPLGMDVREQTCVFCVCKVVWTFIKVHVPLSSASYTTVFSECVFVLR